MPDFTCGCATPPMWHSTQFGSPFNPSALPSSLTHATSSKYIRNHGNKFQLKFATIFWVSFFSATKRKKKGSPSTPIGMGNGLQFLQSCGGLEFFGSSVFLFIGSPVFGTSLLVWCLSDIHATFRWQLIYGWPTYLGCLSMELGQGTPLLSCWSHQLTVMGF